MSAKTIHYILAIALLAATTSCKTMLSSTDLTPVTVQIPFMKNSSNECYFLDEFMPTPDAMITGRNGNLALRYYSFKGATYKEWQNTRINLSFYSHDMKCWSLYEEFYSAN
jgi:hypothetical protein